MFSCLKCDIYTCSIDLILELNVHFWSTLFFSNSIPCPFPLLLCCHWMTRKALSCCDILGPHSHLSLCSHSISNPFWWVASCLCWCIRAKRWSNVSVFTQWRVALPPLTWEMLSNCPVTSLPQHYSCAHACFLISFKFSILFNRIWRYNPNRNGKRIPFHPSVSYVKPECTSLSRVGCTVWSLFTFKGSPL